MHKSRVWTDDQETFGILLAPRSRVPTASFTEVVGSLIFLINSEQPHFRYSAKLGGRLMHLKIPFLATHLRAGSSSSSHSSYSRLGHKVPNDEIPVDLDTAVLLVLYPLVCPSKVKVGLSSVYELLHAKVRRAVSMGIVRQTSRQLSSRC